MSWDDVDPAEVDQPTAICEMCGERVPAELLLGHLRAVHDLDVEIETWPDGEPVIIDATLEPANFVGYADEDEWQ